MAWFLHWGSYRSKDTREGQKNKNKHADLRDTEKAGRGKGRSSWDTVHPTPPGMSGKAALALRGALEAVRCKECTT